MYRELTAISNGDALAEVRVARLPPNEDVKTHRLPTGSTKIIVQYDAIVLIRPGSKYTLHLLSIFVIVKYNICGTG